jgi:hypothetical protein
LSAITVVLDLHKDSPQIQILTDSAFSINTLRNYAIDPHRYAYHPHKELLRQADAIIKMKDEFGLQTHIGRVKSHTGVTHNDGAYAGARGMVDGDTLPEFIFTSAEPPIGGLQTWPLIKVTHADNNCSKKQTYKPTCRSPQDKKSTKLRHTQNQRHDSQHHTP